MFDENTELFREWLITYRKSSKKVAGDVVSRCKRIERIISTPLHEAVSSPESYLYALEELSLYVASQEIEDSSKYYLITTLKSAMTRYCEFVYPDTFLMLPRWQYATTK